MIRDFKIRHGVYARESQSVRRYLDEIGTITLLSAEEEVALVRKIKAGDKEALDRLTKANLRFVVSVAHHYQHQGLALADLINEGNIGLMKAAARFDETQGFKFITYAVWWIQCAILEGLIKTGRLIRLPVHEARRRKKIAKLSESFEQSHERPPTNQELAELLEIDARAISAHIDAAQPILCFDAPLMSGEEQTLLDITDNGADPCDKELSLQSLSQEIHRMLSVLDQRERIIIRHQFELEQCFYLSTDTLAERFQVTHQRIDQLRNKALHTLRLYA